MEFKIYLPIVNGALLFDNSNGKHELIAHKTIDKNMNIVDVVKFNQLKNTQNDHS